MSTNLNEKKPLDDNELEKVNGGLFGRGKKKKEVHVCPFCGGEGEKMPISSDEPTERYECQKCYKVFY